jgi:ABC-type glycerol-3-phosphate transport system permease component
MQMSDISNSISRRRLLGSTFHYAACLLLVLIVLFPLSWVLFGSFKSPSEIFAYPPSILPQQPTLQNYSEVITRTGLPVYMMNTTIVTVVTVVLTLFFGSMAAYGFSRWNFRFKNVLLVTLLIFQLIPSAVNIIPFYLMASWADMLNSRITLIAIYSATQIPFVIWIMKGIIDSIPRSLDEAAIIDGCSWARVFFSIILPLSLPGLAASGFLVFLHSWSEFVLPLVLAGSNDVAVVSVGIYRFFGMDTSAYNYAFAASVLSSLPVLIGYLFAQEFLVSGLTKGSDK